MKRLLSIAFILIASIQPAAAQQNWVAVPCSKMKSNVAINKMIVDSLHNEIILISAYGSTVCNTVYKGIVAYNGSGFHDLNYGINTHNSANPMTGAVVVLDCIPYGNKTLFGGQFFLPELILCLRNQSPCGMVQFGIHFLPGALIQHPTGVAAVVLPDL